MIIFYITSCTDVQLVENWKNPDIDSYEPYKVLVVGLTANIEAREKFEKQLKEELELRGSEIVMSIDLLNPSFGNEKMTEDEIKVLENNLINDGFDTVLFSKIVGIEDKITYKRNYDAYSETNRKFREDYLKYQDIFYTPDYFDEYTVYHAETSMYCICPTKDRELIWKGYIDIIDPKSIDETVNDYVRLLIVVLEEQQLINTKTIEQETLTKDTKSI